MDEPRFSEELGSPERAVLRDREGIVCSLSPDLPSGRYTLHHQGDLESYHPICAPEPEVDSGASLEWVQEPPYGAAIWLHAKAMKSGGVVESCRGHYLAPPPAVRVLVGPPADQERLLGGLRVRLWSAAMADVTDKLHAGPVALARGGAGGGVVAAWPQMAILEPSSSQGQGAAGGAAQTSAAALGASRGAKGHYHISVEGPGCQGLWLSDGGTPAPVVVKSERFANLHDKDGKSWRARKLGPFACHGRCTPSHIGADGCKLCREA
jgi:hypothetical protein